MTNATEEKKVYVTSWDTGEVIASFPIDDLTKAKKHCKGLGSITNDSSLFTSHSPVAYVANDSGECIYNPRFAKQS